MRGWFTRRQTIVPLLVLCAASVVAQDRAPNDFLAVSQAHRVLTRYTLDISVNVGSGEQALQAHVQCINTDQCARTVGTVTVLQTREWTIAADRSRRTLTVSARDSSPTPATEYPSPEKVLGDWLKTGAKISGGELTETGRRWLLKPSNPRQPVAELFTDRTTHLLSRIVYGSEANASQRVEILYRWNAVPVNEAQLDPRRYILVQGKNIQAAGDHATFRVIRVESE